MAIAHDVVVIGGGPAGYAAALFASASGLDVGLVEESKLGGTCLHVGCIPAKELLETASVLRTVQHASEFGVTVGDPAVDLVVSQERKQKVVDGLFKGLAGLLASREVAVYAGTGRLGVDHTVTVDGGDPAVLEIRDHGPGLDDTSRRHLFDPFFSGRQAGRGLGFGLPKCWRIVTLHGGRIEAEPLEPTGLNVRVTWPSAP